MDFTVVVIVFLCAVIIVMSALLASSKRVVEEMEKGYTSLNNRYQRELDGKRTLDKEVHYLRNRIYNLEKENLKLKEEYVPRETFNKGYGSPEVVDWINAHYKEGSN